MCLEDAARLSLHITAAEDLIFSQATAGGILKFVLCNKHMASDNVNEDKPEVQVLSEVSSAERFVLGHT